ncbi:MAG: DNA methylase [Spirochaetes bacterium GWF1_41_5]|nr:MAG: DNA methylase [Spirochaetes bacterium GWF1_41_5]HBE04318.1 DNA methylase [Spirochaetia bacterium]
MPKPKIELCTTTLWEYPSQHYDKSMEDHSAFAGATPAWVIWNLLERYTKKNDLVVDPMAGSGTTITVARSLNRRGLGYDLEPVNNLAFRCDARKLPLENKKADFVFVDPPYSTHLEYSKNPACIGKLHADSREYFDAMRLVLNEIKRILRPAGYMALYVSDSYENRKPFMPIGFRLFSFMENLFSPVDIICVKRRNSKLERPHWQEAAREGNFFLRGFNYLFIMQA